MESQLQNAEFRTNPENFHPSIENGKIDYRVAPVLKTIVHQCVISYICS